MMDRVPLALAAFLIFSLIRYCCVPRRIPGISYNRFSYIFPFGDLMSLACFYNFGPGEVFRWFNVQSLHHQRGIFQVFLASFSTASPVVVVTDPAEVKSILTQRAGVIDRASLLALLFSLMAPKASIGKSSGAEFKAQRYLWNGMLSPEFLETVVGPRSWDAIVKLVEIWSLEGRSTDSVPFEGLETLRCTFFEAIVGIVLGRDLGVLDSDISHHRTATIAKSSHWGWITVGKSAHRPLFVRRWRIVQECVEWVVTGIAPAAYAWMFGHVFWPFIVAQRHVKARLQTVIEEERNRAQDSDKSESLPESALDLVFRRAASNIRTEQAVTDDVLMSELVELLITGHETTSVAMSWAVKYLADHQAVQEKLFHELQQCMPTPANTVPTSDEIKAACVPYLEAFIAETLRLACVGPISFREAKADCTIGGQRIAAGTPIILMTQDVTQQGMPTIAGSPNKSWVGRDASPQLSCFCPERWLDSEGNYNPDATYSIPFSVGARGCFGKKIALLEMRIAVTVLLWNFRFEKLGAEFSGYTASDRLTRRPNRCFVLPVPRTTGLVLREEARPVRLPPLGPEDMK